jgi:nicotinamide mononucleotide (NMN) deamidase PncC
MPLLNDQIRAFHASGRQAMLAITGGGSAAISRLLAVPGGSRSVLEAIVPYANDALKDWLGRAPDHYCSADAALAMASVAWQRAVRLGGDTQNVIGVSCTASLASSTPKRGAHRCWIATQSAQETRLAHLTLTKGARTRAEEEDVVADLVLDALFATAGLAPIDALTLLSGEAVAMTVIQPSPLIREVWMGERTHAWSLGGGVLADEIAERPRGLIPGSFNPAHAGHRELRAVAQELLGGPVAFELAIVNADKPRLDFHSIDQRCAQFDGDLLAITSAPLFLDKARVFPGATFVVGYDTAERLIDPRFYGHSEARMHSALAELRERGAHFLVAGRAAGSTFLSGDKLALPTGFEDLFTSIPESRFRADVSSSALRQAALRDVD